ncbi:DUF3987 domain-containing protein [Sporomusa acidovorans]|uniref:DUF3987 domain-containing protein n=1 Tax=Sporomusa acidovorans TaxID=112900 RepID=UPI0015A43425|nr:DUF3987 domain-containing protein [Sporomusa acidovorans]
MDIIEAIKERLLILDAYNRYCIGGALKEKNGEYWGCCPFHNEDTASFSVNPQKGSFYCFGCGAKGDVIELVKLAKGFANTADTIKFLADELGLNNEPPKQAFDWSQATKDREHVWTTIEGQEILKKEIWKMPDGQKQALWFHKDAGQWLKGKNGLQCGLYRQSEVQDDIENHRTIYAVEGEKDCDTVRGHGLAATTVGGASDYWKVQHINIIPPGHEVVILGDNDLPGRNLQQDTARKLYEHGCKVKVIDLPGLPLKGDITDWLSAGHTKDELSKLVEQAQEYTSQYSQNPQNDEWPEIIPLSSYTVPTFPVQCLPDWLQRYTTELSIATQTPIDLSCMLVLSVIVAAVARKVEIMPHDGWREPLNIYTVTALPPASRKSAVFTECTLPLVEYEKGLRQSKAAEVRTAQNEFKALEQALQQAQSAKAKALANGKSLEHDAINELSKRIEEFQVPSMPRLVADDSTIESIAALLAEQQGRMAIMSAEGDLFDILAGRYSSGNIVNIGVVLKGHSGDFVRVDRIGRGSISIDNPALTIGLAIQPDVLRGLVQKPGFRGRGLLGRFLYSLPQSNIGHRNINTIALSEMTHQRYCNKIKSLLDLQFHGYTNVLLLDDAAKVEFIKFEEWLEPNLADGGELASITDWGGKLSGAVARIAGILYMAKHAGDNEPWKQRINRDEINNAVKIGSYLIEHAKAAFNIMGDNEDIESAKIFLRWIEKTGVQEFKKRDLFQSIKGSFPRVEMLDAGLSILLDYGYIRKKVSEKNKAGRPSVIYEVNPKYTSQNSQNTQNPLVKVSFGDIEDIENSLQGINLLGGEF